MRIYFGLAVLAVLLSALPAAAQTDRRVGITIGHPTQIGVLWHITGRVAIRPEISFSTGRTETEIEFGGILPGTPTRVITVEGDLSSFTADFNVLLTVKSWDAVRLNVVPSYRYLRTSSTSIASVFAGGLPSITTEENVSDTHGGGVALGVQYTPHERFAILAEAGLQFASSVRGPDAGFRLKTLGTSGMIGAVFYF